ncbi:hypothetical protein SCHPADRAFT_822684 [Schizopora paradoxa]|uniref:Nucleoside diphosphate kinase n=1 Tax=Schizopora paradoxa TaxID=27342 RepID=A0A0H2RXF4_9AGAM|nr:hypothetical protein SCHPADRAFT_822684 [Schizopora paradoxa]
MSDSSPNTPRSSNASFETEGADASSRRLTRTVALIKQHALEHRMDIERRVEEAGFEISKERQMEFTAESDQEYLHELFGDDTPALFEGPVWIYVLARRRAVSVFRTLMGPADPIVAREQAPNSLRAIYGTSIQMNAVGAARDEATAEEMITALFESSPPFEPTVGLDDELAVGGYDDDGDRVQAFLSPTSSQTRSSTNSDNVKARTNSGIVPLGSNPHFKARPLPKSTRAPSSQPRMTRAAALRSGSLVIAPTPFKDRHKELKKVVPTREELKQVFLDVPGHKRSLSIAVASTAPPTVAPRMTRAASLRIGGGATNGAAVKRPAPRPSVAIEAKAKVIFEGVPGHKRRESFSVASVRAPTVAPRLNKSAELRAKKDAPPTSYMFRTPSTPKANGTTTPSLSRATSQNNLSNGSPSRPRSSMAGPNPTLNTAPTLTRASSSLALSPPPRPPSIEPRQNRSAMLRAAKKFDAEGKPVVEKKKPSHPPVSMKNITNSRALTA